MPETEDALFNCPQLKKREFRIFTWSAVLTEKNRPKLGTGPAGLKSAPSMFRLPTVPVSSIGGDAPPCVHIAGFTVICCTFSKSILEKLSALNIGVAVVWLFGSVDAALSVNWAM